MGAGSGTYVICNRWAPKSETARHSVSRAICFFLPVPEVCCQCPHSRFVFRIKVGVGNQVVACPQFSQREGWKRGEQPVYIRLRREACLSQHRRYQFCEVCQNVDPAKPPQQEPDWVKVEQEKLHRRPRVKEVTDDSTE